VPRIRSRKGVRRGCFGQFCQGLAVEMLGLELAIALRRRWDEACARNWMAFEYVGFASCLKLVSAAFENPFVLEHIETAQQKRDQSKGGPIGWTSVSLSLSVSPSLSLATPHLSPHVSSQLSALSSLFLSTICLSLTIALLSPRGTKKRASR